MKVELSVQEIQALHASFLTLLNGKLSITMWSKIFDILEVLEKELVSVQSKEKNLRETISKQYPDKEDKDLTKEEIEERNKQFQEGMQLIFEKRIELTIPEFLTIQEIKNIKGIDISGRDFLNLRSFCELLKYTKENEKVEEVVETEEQTDDTQN